jgi:undecaprenyl-diphosphatase
MDLIQEIFQAIVLGLVQGITEFLPISGTAHLLVVTKAFGWTDLVGQNGLLMPSNLAASLLFCSC